MIPQNDRPVNTPIRLDSLFDGDARQVNRAERLAMTAAEMIRAAGNRWHIQYGVFRVYQGGVGWVECATPYHDPSTHPWVHLLPVGWRTMPTGTFRTYLVRAAAPHYGAPDWIESQLMYDIYQRHLDSQGPQWLEEYRQYIAENGINDPLEDWQ